MIAHVTASLSTAGGGVAEVVSQLSSKQLSQGQKVRCLALADSGKKLDSWSKESPELSKNRKGLLTVLEEIRPEIVHSHGLWSAPSLVVPVVGRRHKTPWIVSPHGMLDEWALQQGRWKKRIALATFEGRHLRKSACLHALCQAEADSCRMLGLSNPIAVIPNGIDCPEIETEDQTSSVKKLLFLGRVHPKKGLAAAIRAWSDLDDELRKQWTFVIAGWDQQRHTEELVQLCNSRQLNWTSGTKVRDEGDLVQFYGPAFGSDKRKLLGNATAFCLPSQSEGLPMSVLEAWSYRLPVIMTSACNLPEGFSADAAADFPGADSSLQSQALRTFLSLDPATLASMGQNGRRLAETTFSWETVSESFTELYNWCLGTVPQPSFVSKS